MNRKKIKTDIIRCKLCKNNVVNNNSIWNQHIFGKKHRLLLPEEITLGVPEGITDLEPYRSYLENIGSLKLFRYNSTENSIVFSFDDINAFTPFIQRDSHIINNITHSAAWKVKSVADLTGLLKSFNPEKVQSPMPATTSKPIKQVKQENAKGKQPAAFLNSSQLRQLTPIETGDSYRDSIREKLPRNLPFEETVQALLKLLKPDANRSKEITKLICNDLKAALPFDAKILIYGSRFANLEFENSDLNVHITNLRKRPDDIQKVLDTLKHNVELTNKFEDPNIVEYRKQHFLQAKHKATGIMVEIFVKNIIPVYNSELIKFYLGQEQKINSLTILIKFWFQCYNLIKKPSFMVYDLYQMIIFFLQRPPYSLPSIAELQQTAMSKNHDGWEFGINSKRQLMNEQLQSATISQLFTGFMRFYTKFDYFTYCICPFTGYPVEKIDFYDKLPWEFQNLASRTPANPNFCFIPKFGLTVQDPFEHTKSIAYIPYFAMPKVISLCRGAWYNMNSKKPDLHKLLSNCMSGRRATQTFELVRSKQNESDESNMLWFKKVREMLSDVMSKVLICSVEETPVVIENKTPPLVEKINYKCVGKENVWHNRITNLKEIWNTMNGRSLSKLEREIAISAETAKTNTQLETEFGFTLMLKLKPCKAAIFYRFMSKPLVFEHVKSYLMHMLPKWIEELEEQMCDGNIQEKKFDVKQEPAGPVVPENAPKQVKPAQQKQQETLTRKDPEAVLKKEPEIVPAKEPETVVPKKELETEPKPEKLPEQQQQQRDEENKDDDEATQVLDGILLDENFLEGLDVIDAWDDDEKPRNPSPEKERSKSHRSRSRTYEASHRSRSKTSHRSRSKTNDTSSSKRPRSERRRSRSLQKPRKSRSPRRRPSLTRSYEPKRRRSRSSEKSATRRDPEKTKRDIHRDKLKCAKDVEKKIISNKLEMVKTGLVPPGMEMEPEYAAGGSSKKIPTIISRTVEGKAKRPHPSEPGARFSRAAKRANKEAQQSRADLKKYHESFLKEVREKLNEVRQPEVMMQHQQPQVHQQEYDEQFFIGNSYVAPPQQQHVMYPPANNAYMPVHTQMQQHQDMQMYSTSYPMMQQQGLQQQNQNSFAPVNYSATIPQYSTLAAAPSTSVEAQEAPQAPRAPPPPVLSRNEFEAANWNPERPPDREEHQAQKPKSKEEIGKLFADKKISLSDFLTITAKPEVQSATTEQLQKKIKAISKCQDVIRVMTDGASFAGGIIIRNTNTEATVAKKPHQSPLHRLPKIRFQLNTSDVNMSPYSAALNYILKTGGIIKEAINLDGGEGRTRSTDGGDDSVALSRKASQLSQQNQPAPPPIQQVVVVEECKECQKRKLIEFCTIGTQVNEEELIPPKRKQQESLVYMTPAQLLENENRSKGAQPPPPLMNSKFMQQHQQQQRNVPFFQPPNKFSARMKNVEQQKNDRFRNNELFNRKNHNPNNTWY